LTTTDVDTKIDWPAYMQQVDMFLSGERDYSKLEGDTGPLVWVFGRSPLTVQIPCAPSLHPHGLLQAPPVLQPRPARPVHLSGLVSLHFSGRSNNLLSRWSSTEVEGARNRPIPPSTAHPARAVKEGTFNIHAEAFQRPSCDGTDVWWNHWDDAGWSKGLDDGVCAVQVGHLTAVLTVVWL
jgi:hypothetical protein